jgi:hypothetical protein
VYWADSQREEHITVAVHNSNSRDGQKKVGYQLHSCQAAKRTPVQIYLGNLLIYYFTELFIEYV